MNIKFVKEIERDSFGLWLSALFSAIGSWNPGLTFDQQKDAFFYMIEYLLVNGKIKFIKPGADCYISPDNPHPKFSIDDKRSHWDLDAKQIVSCLKESWPEGVVSECDGELTIYFYEIPGVIWIDENGLFFAS
ncbi:MULTISPECIES: hypothetical protein [Pseudomonas]|jgi:hypothetical protein|uniref:hypothetical protein n=1 Tax=Pseudomonas TaxID=286 RepID=UPI0005FAB73A|nr:MULTISPECIES: hypothetical protein [Pseudomonas]KJZ33237.1 hypothetical protein VC33_28420 [Pseudomonas fluorescens]OOG11869.1 hypothetical protein BMS17_07140 [Pseudomonas sp. C9]